MNSLFYLDDALINLAQNKMRIKYLDLISCSFPSSYTPLSTNGFQLKYKLFGLLEIIIAHYLYVTEVIVFCRNRKWVLPSKSTLRAGNLITKNRRRITGS